jgi:vacuolar-type H+-ATPase subunit I/STV1
MKARLLIALLWCPLIAGLVTTSLSAQAPISDPTGDDRIVRALERIAGALERLERSQGQEVWLRRAEMSAISQREVKRQLVQSRSRLASLEEERQMLLVHLEQLEELERDPNNSMDQLENQRRELEGRLDLIRPLRRQAEARTGELESRLASAQRDLEDRLADIDRQLRAP